MSDIQRIDAGPRLSEALIYDGRIYTSGFVAEEKAGGSIFDQTADVFLEDTPPLPNALGPG